MTIVLGIESSCDETGVALYESKRGLLAHDLHSQIEMHKQYGGVVPELASRDHIQRLIPLVRSVLDQAQVSLSEISGIAYTAGPGLIGALLTGAAFARSLAWSLNIPAIGIHHLEAHLLAPCLEVPAPRFPFIALLVSGGHTQLIQVNDIGDYILLGETLDDAAGEAFDKTAKLLGLGYPGGAALAKLAESGHPKRFSFPRPMTDKPGLDFSFSGLKTCVLTTYKKQPVHDAQLKADIAFAFQEAVIDTLVIKCRRAIEQTKLTRLVVAGGVSANVELRHHLHHLMANMNGQVFFPKLEFCTDNGAMVAFAGCQRLLKGERDDLTIKAKARWEMSSPTFL